CREGRAGSGCCRIWRRPTRSWWRWTRSGPGSATTTCSPICCSCSCVTPRRGRSPGCISGRPGGWRGTGTRWRRAARRRRAGAGGARDWGRAARLLADHWPGLYLGGQAATVHALLAGFPAGAAAVDAELAALFAADELALGSLAVAGRYAELAERGSPSVPEGRRGPALVLLGVVRIMLSGQRGDMPGGAEEARRLMDLAPGAALPGLGEEL